MKDPGTPSPTQTAAPAGSPFRHKVFTVIWIATVVSNIGGWMYNVASGWLMTSLDPERTHRVVGTGRQQPADVPVRNSCGCAGRHRESAAFLIVGSPSITVMSTAFAALVWLHFITPVSLLVFSFIVSGGSAMTAPAWQAVVAKLVPKSDLPTAIAANSAGINVSRAIGPAIGGAIVGSLGIAAPFWFNAFSNIGVIGALVLVARAQEKRLPPAAGTVRKRDTRRASGTRDTTHISAATLIRTMAFFIFAQRLLGAATAGGAHPNHRRTGALRDVARRHRSFGRGRCVPAEAVQGPTGTQTTWLQRQLSAPPSPRRCLPSLTSPRPRWPPASWRVRPGSELSPASTSRRRSRCPSGSAVGDLPCT